MIRMVMTMMTAFALCFLPAAAQELPEGWEKDEIAYARISTSMGTIDLALNETRAPVTVANFFAYAEKGLYDQTIFHRVVPGRLIQGGGYSRSLIGRAPMDPIENEATNGLDNVRGSIAMARQTDPHSASNQWFINLRHNQELNHEGEEYMLDWGYAVFGQVVAGMAVVDAIGLIETTADGQFDELPVETVLITRVDRIDADQVGQN